ncbi:MAG: hypothetical protein ACK2T5_15895, partial [Anaerolineales bacterium]
LTSIAFVFQICALAILINAKSLMLLYLYAACLGISWGSILTSLPSLISINYPRDRYAQVMGLIFPFQVFSQAIGATAAGAVYDATGGYKLAFIGLLTTCTLGFFSTWMARTSQKT